MFGALANGGRGALGLLKRIPILGTLLAAGGAAFDIFGSESDSSLSRRDKDKAAGTSVGGWVGSIGGVGAGALAGSMLGPVGTIVGGIVGGFLGDQAGQIIGDKFGGWVSDLREADIPGKIAGAWDGAVSTMSTAFSESWAKVKDIGGLVTQVIGEQIGGLADYIKANTGIDLKQQGAARLDRTKANAGGAWDFAKKAAASLVDKTMQSVDWMGKNTTVGKAIGKAASAFQGGSIHGMSPAQFAALAADTRRTESGGNTSAENKYGYIGAYQFGAAALADTGLVDAAKLKAAQKSGRFNQKTFLADPANWLMAGGKDAFLADQALQDQTYSKYSEQLQKAGLRSGVLSAGSTPEQIAAYVKAAHLVGAGGANKFFTRGIDSADANGTLASKYAKQGAMAVASVSTPQIGPMPKIPTIPAIAEAPKVIEPLGSPAAPAFTVNLPPQDVGQNLSDRRIAQIASGGIG
ncbi:hypothetical protein [Methylomonas sp. UP202]|uniref:hypothetical protein n=1 Tax=Methylomonas sp. UP202 TaxID=3040943 RepID=UPI00247890EA|nr:hypothetical protein [Methylomonas sp. UP202]WGS85016.1 hypothetical protein QC632_18465 [Methylomonas sp. UP202]